jgi:hypothetical protein
MAVDDKLPPINVRMGDNNQVGHVGHIVFEAPPPSPNSIWVNGELVGEMGPGGQMVGPTTYHFPKLFTDRFLDIGAEIEVQKVRLRISCINAMTRSSRGGRPSEVTLWGVTCELLR